MAGRTVRVRRNLFLGLLIAAPVLSGVRPCAQQVCQVVGTPVVLNGAIMAGDTAQTGRLFRDGRASTCSFSRTPTQSGGPYLADVHPLTNTTGQSVCATVTYDASGCGVATNQIQVNAYSAYNPATPLTGVLADAGFSTGPEFRGHFSFPLALGQSYNLVVTNVNSGTFCPSYTVTVTYRAGCRAAGYDVTPDGLADATVFRPSTGVWYSLNSGGGFTSTQFGAATDTITPGDYTGDRRSEPSVYRNATNVWYYSTPGGGIAATPFGAPGDLPVPGDADRDGRSDVRVFRPSTGTFFSLRSSDGGVEARPWGLSGDIPISGDFDGDYITDWGVVRPNAGALDWYVLLTSITLGANMHFPAGNPRFGLATDKIVPADYDGDGKADIAVWRDGTWYYHASSTATGGPSVLGQFRAFQFGAAGDIPQPSDRDGDLKADFVVFRPSTGLWYSWLSLTGTLRVEPFGQLGDQPASSQQRVGG